jgi:hypothetical protein
VHRIVWRDPLADYVRARDVREGTQDLRKRATVSSLGTLGGSIHVAL